MGGVFSAKLSWKDAQEIQLALCLRKIKDHEIMIERLERENYDLRCWVARNFVSVDRVPETVVINIEPPPVYSVPE